MGGSARRARNGDSRRNRKRRPDSRAPEERGLAGPGFAERVLRGTVGTIQFLLLLTLLVSAGAQSRYIFFKALYFRIQDISVKGNRALEPRDVVRLSGLDLGDLFFKYNYEKVKERIRSNRRVEKVRIVVISPNSIEIQIQEKTPKFYLLDAIGQQVEVDRRGAILGPRVGDQALPLILGARYDEASEGEPQIDPRQRDVLSRWVHTLEASPFAGFSSLDITHSHGVVVHWENLELIVSDPETFGRHLELVDPIVARAASEGRQVSQIDLRFPNIFVRFREIPIPDAVETPPTPPDEALVEGEDPDDDGLDGPLTPEDAIRRSLSEQGVDLNPDALYQDPVYHPPIPPEPTRDPYATPDRFRGPPTGPDGRLVDPRRDRLAPVPYPQDPPTYQGEYR